MEELTGLVFDIHRGTTSDGPGMRTTAFLKGCPLKCEWCQNPESICTYSQPVWNEVKCIGCMSCVKSCKNNAITADEKGIHIDKNKCKRCFACTDECPTNALKQVGKKYTVKQLAKELCKDDMFFDEFDGGITLSGGEATMQSDFVKELFVELKKSDKNIALDTCGLAKSEVFEQLFPLTDIFLYDIKLLDSDEHKKFTGVDNSLILHNFELLISLIKKDPTKKIWIRTPLIPKATATIENISKIANYLNQYKDYIERWELCAFNNVCKDKYRQLDIDWKYKKVQLMNKEMISPLVDKAKELYKGNIVQSGLVAK